MDIALLQKLRATIRFVMDKNNKRFVPAVIAGCFLLVVLYIVFVSRPSGPFEADSGSRPVMGTFGRVVAVSTDKKTVLDCIKAAFEQIHKVDELMSYHDPDSEISSVNQKAFKESVKVSSSTYRVIQKSIEFSRLTDGTFDVTVGPLVDLWRKAADANTAPTEQQLQQVRSKVGYDKLILNEADKSIRFAVEGMRIDLGGIAKGFAIDRAIEAVRKIGGLGAMVDIGGDIRCYGKTPKGQKYWLVGLQNPDLESEKQNLLTLKLTDKAVTTSGNYHRFFIIGGKHYSHIINQKTGGIAEGLSSVTIIADNAADADALATAVSVMGVEKGLQLIENTPNTEAIVISASPDYEIKKTSAADKYIK